MSKHATALALILFSLPLACSSEPNVDESAADPVLDEEPGASGDVVGSDPASEPEPEPEPAPEPDSEDPDKPAKPSGPLKIWMSPTGNDASSGLTPATAVKTLSRVQSLLVAKHGKKPWPQDVEVRIAPGRYVGQRVDWTHTSPTRKVTFMPAAADKNRPVFDGCSSASQCVTGSFFRLDSRRGEKTNLTFEYIEVVRYQTAISLEADRNTPSKFNGGNRIYGCRFANIGNAYAPGIAPSTAAVRLVNSDDNTIENNHFDDIVNTTSPAILHAIYAAHGSDRNAIARNSFLRNSGDPVRLRDFSNGNVITKNRFNKVGIAAGYTEWYCDHDVRDDCTKPTAECPSWNNQFRDNQLNGTATCAPLPVFVYFQDDTATGCKKPAGASRLSTSGNTQSTSACVGQ